MKTASYISQLLYRYQFVTVPGFGAFLTEIQSAQWNANSNAFYPPKKLISFNSHLKNNDGLLANHIAQTEKTTYENAVVAIENEVSAWKKALQLDGKIALKVKLFDDFFWFEFFCFSSHKKRNCQTKS
jgi:hypothetical protein